jgi:hypothetical protein
MFAVYASLLIAIFSIQETAININLEGHLYYTLSYSCIS